MAESKLNPIAATFTMPSEKQLDVSNSNSNDNTSAPGANTASITANGDVQTTRSKRSDTKSNPSTVEKSNVTQADLGAGEEVGTGVKLTGAQLKKQKAAEKAARRAEKIADRGIPAQAQETVVKTQQQQQQQQQQQGPVEAREKQERDRQRRMSVANKDGGGGGSVGAGHKRAPSTTVKLPTRGGPAGQQQQQAQQQVSGGDKSIATPSSIIKDKSLDKRVPMLSHLYPTTSSTAPGRKASLATADRQIHPAVLTLGIQLRDYVICGSSARTIATLLVFKKVIQSYETPSGVALSRDLTRHLSHQISYLNQARQLCVAQGNSIRWIKKLISTLNPDTTDTDAKAFLCDAVDTFIREKITFADQYIATQAVSRIADGGDVILTYGKSSVVEQTLLKAFEAGKKFKVIVADSRPLFEGKNLARSLLRAGLQDVQYCLLNGLADVVEQEDITKCFLGASAMLGNGRLSSRAGTALVAMMTKESKNAQGTGKIPVIVLCESLKFTAKVALDSLAMNEIADPELLVEQSIPDVFTTSDASSSIIKTIDSQKKGGGVSSNKKNNNEEDSSEKDNHGLEGWGQQQNLFLVNLMYDVTPAQYIDLVISELGALPPTAVPVVNGVHGGDE